MKYINFTKDEQIEFMQLVKSKTKLTWESLAHSLFISRSMIFFYLDGHSKIPKASYEKLCKLSGLKPVKEDCIEIKNKTEEIIFPKLDARIAEFIGILAGDGHLSSINYEVSVVCHKFDDNEYVTNHVTTFFQLFGLNSKVTYSKLNNAIKCRVYSKALCAYLRSRFLIPIGKKKGNLKIPAVIRKKNSLLKSYIRGLFDTDGSIYLRRKKSMVVSIVSKDPEFLDEVKGALIQLDFSPSVSGKNLYIYSQDQIRRFFKEVKPANKKHLDKFNKAIDL